MQILTQELSPDAAYKLLIGLVVPRPIAWVTTTGSRGQINAAPFSAFTFLSNKPPMIGISIGRKAGILKDTARNIMATREFVVNIANEDLLEPLHLSAREFPESISEVEELQLETVKSMTISTPRLSAAPAALECVLQSVHEFGDYRTSFIVGEVQAFHIRDDHVEDGKVDTAQLRPIARLGGPHYAHLGEIVTMQRIGVTPK